jgi:hypothetical protein
MVEYDQWRTGSGYEEMTDWQRLKCSLWAGAAVLVIGYTLYFLWWVAIGLLGYLLSELKSNRPPVADTEISQPADMVNDRQRPQ